MGHEQTSLDLTFGPEVTEEGSRFRLWAPSAERVELLIHRVLPPKGDNHPRLKEGLAIPLPKDRDGWARSELLPLGHGTRYAYRINGELEVPDPASRFQPRGVHGPSELVDLRLLPGIAGPAIAGRRWEETVLYELHTGTFTREGSFAALRRRLDHLERLGVTAVELMPIGAFPGERNWGYDGVLPYAPASAYGNPGELAGVISEAHRRGLQLFLDVVYNHFGPDGNYLHLYAAPFFTDRFTTPWGAAIDFSLPEVRRFFLENARYWLFAYGFDGLRIDAVHAIRDESKEHFVQELARRVSEEAERRTPGRRVHVVLENEENEAWRLREASAQWNDDVHHLLHCLITGEQEGYYQDYSDTPHTDLAKTAAEGFYFQGQPSKHRNGAPRGTVSTHLPPNKLVAFSQNHDQVGNRAFGERPTALAPSPDAEEAVEAFVLLLPQTPMLFMGEEWGSRRPFLFFCDYQNELAQAVREGRRKEFAGFAPFNDAERRALIPDPNARETRDASVLDWELLYGEGAEGSVVEPERLRAAERFTLVRELLGVRKRELQPWLSNALPGFYEGRDGAAFRVGWPLIGGRFWVIYGNLTGTHRELPRFPAPGKQRILWRSGRRPDPDEARRPDPDEARGADPDEAADSTVVQPGAVLGPWTVIATIEGEE